VVAKRGIFGRSAFFFTWKEKKTAPRIPFEITGILYVISVNFFPTFHGANSPRKISGTTYSSYPNKAERKPEYDWNSADFAHFTIGC
jgi:hypothetical protein